MSTEAAMTGALPASAEAKKTFAVCFAALVATSFCFILRAFSIGAWGTEFDLSQTQMGELAGVATGRCTGARSCCPWATAPSRRASTR